jgi:hypothetical protein
MLKLDEVLSYYQTHKDDPKIFEQDYFLLGICEIQAGNYISAQEYFANAVTIMFGLNPYWRASGLVDWLVNVSVLAGIRDNFPSVLEELTLYRISATKSHPGGRSPLAHYCYSVMELMYPSQGDMQYWIKDLLKRPTYKDMVAVGHAIDAISKDDGQGFTRSLQELLIVHEGMAKYGQLRQTPEGWLCLSAMCLAVIARQKGFSIKVESDYFSFGYLEFICNRYL